MALFKFMLAGTSADCSVCSVDCNEAMFTSAAQCLLCSLSEEYKIYNDTSMQCSQPFKAQGAYLQLNIQTFLFLQRGARNRA